MALDVRKPLEKVVPIKKPSNEWAWIQLKYERIPVFCYYCKRLGNNEKLCVDLYENPEVGDDCEYGPWMKAEIRRSITSGGEQWLVNSKPVEKDEVGNQEERTKSQKGCSRTCGVVKDGGNLNQGENVKGKDIVRDVSSEMNVNVEDEESNAMHMANNISWVIIVD